MSGVELSAGRTRASRIRRAFPAAVVLLPGIFLGCIFVADVFQQSIRSDSLGLLRNWFYSEFLTAYLPGFLRRGLLGELAIRLTAWFSFGPTEVQRSILALCATSFMALVVLVFARLRRGLQGHPALLVLLLSSPFLFAFPILDGSFIRKDSLNLLIFLLAYSLLEKGSGASSGQSRSSASLTVLGLMLFAIGSLIHESFLFFCLLPTLLSLIASGWNHSIGRLGVMGLALIFISVVTLSTLFHGGPETAGLLCERWSASGLDLGCGRIPPGAFRQFSLSGTDALAQTGHHLGTLNGGYWMLLVGACVAVLLRATTLALGGCRAARQQRCVTLLAIVVCSIPIYAMAVDWGRWIYINAVTFLILVSSTEFRIALPKTSRAMPDAEVAPPVVISLKGFALALLLVAMLYRLPGWLGNNVLDTVFVAGATLPRFVGMF